MTPLVYFIQAADGPIKIGVSADRCARLAVIQVANAQEVTLLGAFDARPGYEKWLHSRLSQHRIRGEWYQPHPDVFEAIEALSFVAEEAA